MMSRYRGDEEDEIEDRRFVGKTVVITGAGGNFGRKACIFFAERGCNIAAMDNNPSTLQETLLQIRARFGNDFEILPFEVDVRSAKSVQAAVDQVVFKYRKIDMLWNNAGYQGDIKPTLEYDPNDFAAVMNINVTGMFIVLQAVAKVMKEHGGGSIVNTASVAGLRCTPAMVAYAASKAAVLAMTVTTSKDLAPYNIRVNAVSPALIGPDDGPMWVRQNELHAASGSPYFASEPEKVAKAKVNSVPMKRLGTVMEVINSVAFLLSDDASYTTGTNLTIDGGLSAGIKA